MIKNFPVPLRQLSCLWPAWQAEVRPEELLFPCQFLHDGNAQLLALWGSDERSQQQGFCLHLVFVVWQLGIVYLQCLLPAVNPSYPSIADLFPAANRMQRATFDLLGMVAITSDDKRPWLRHAAWPSDFFPLRQDTKINEELPQAMDHYSFVRVSGEGVHEIPVGPVHTGIIESGHFHFQVVGERVLRLEERLGYVHKGIAKLMQQQTLMHGAKIAGRISGDSTVAYAFAYSMAVENISAITVPPRAQWLRALLLERERIMNHLGDLGALGNDAGFGFALMQFLRFKEDMLRLNQKIFSHRYLQDLIIPGGLTIDLTKENCILIENEINILVKEVKNLQTIFNEQAGLQERFAGAGKLTKEVAIKLGVIGFAARASGVANDLRTQFPMSPYNELNVQLCIETAGDVAARVNLRFSEIYESLRVLEFILKKLPEGDVQAELPENTERKIGLGWVEGWRGPVFFAVCATQNNIDWAHAQDPSWQNWPALEHTVIDNIVPDFPLINKSFNLSYSGQDL